MIKSSKFLLLIYFIAFAGIAYFAFPIIKNRYFTKDTPAPAEPTTTEIPQNTTQSNNNEQGSTNTANENISDTTTDEDLDSPEQTSFLDVTRKDCDNNCKNFTDPDELKYCRQFCGLTTSKKIKDGCNNLQDLEKDYCLKQEAIDKSDIKICGSIEDINIKKSCQNRLNEDALDSAFSQPVQ